MHADLPVLLVVEDDFLVRLTMADALTDGGFEVIEAGDAREALHQICERNDITAMLTDINLPGGEDGFALARAVRVIRPDLPVVYASGRYSAAENGKSVDGVALPRQAVHAVARGGCDPRPDRRGARTRCRRRRRSPLDIRQTA